MDEEMRAGVQEWEKGRSGREGEQEKNLNGLMIQQFYLVVFICKGACIIIASSKKTWDS